MKNCCSPIFAALALFWLAAGQLTPNVSAQTPSATQAQQSSPPAKENEPAGMDLIWGFKIPMRDGVRLNGTVVKPAGQQQPLPVIFTLTPYIADGYQDRASYFSQHGYVFVLVDVRGRGNSEGVFEPHAQEPNDGHDIVEFLAQQPWCNGKVAMWGGSYAGSDQWSTLKDLPPHLATAVPVASAHAGVDFPFHRGIWFSYIMQWLTLTSGRTPNDSLFGESALWIGKFRQMYLGQRPFNTLDQIVGNTTTIFQKWLLHPAYHSYWQAMVPTPEQYAKMNVPILTITAAYDADQAGAMAYYREHMKHGNPETKATHYLIIGPWDHAGTRTPKKEVGGLTFGDLSLLDMNNLHRQWYDWTLKNGPKPEFLKMRVAYYVVGPGAENWKYAGDLDAIATEHRKLYLTSQAGAANDVFHSGQMADQPSSSTPDKFVYDPSDIRPAELEKEEDFGKYVSKYLTDERYALNLFGNGVVYHSAPFTEATEISGNVKLTVWMAMDVPDTDFKATLYEILPDGTSVQLSSDLLRARYRESIRTAKLVAPGQITQYSFDGFTWFSRRVSKGSRLRLVLNCINSIYYEKNYNSGGAVESESGKDARVAHVTVYHDAEHPGTLDIPVVQ
jgi:putative CocE/NonD family hydrolase